MDKYKSFGIVSMIFLVSVVLVSAFYYGNAMNNQTGQFSGYLSQTQVDSLNQSAYNVQVTNKSSVVQVDGSTNLEVMTGPMDGPRMFSFEILGLYNPTIRIAAGSAVQFTVINVDTDSYHNFVLSVHGPPYYSMNGMMQDGGAMSSIHYLPPVHSSMYAYTNFSYQFNSPGTYWYLCTYPGHAENGMYGKVIVS